MPVKLDSRDLGLIAVGAFFVLVIAYIGYDQSEKTGQPRFSSSLNQSVTTGFNVIDKAFDHLDTGDHYFHPVFCVPGQTQIFTQHKYPEVTGGNISTLIHQGMSALSKPAPQDNDWITRPPGEVQF
jgi:hypothetical protein